MRDRFRRVVGANGETTTSAAARIGYSLRRVDAVLSEHTLMTHRFECAAEAALGRQAWEFISGRRDHLVLMLRDHGAHPLEDGDPRAAT